MEVERIKYERIGCVARLKDKILLTGIRKHISGGAEITMRFHLDEIHLFRITQCIAHGMTGSLKSRVGWDARTPSCRVKWVHTGDNSKVHQDRMVPAQEGLPSP